MNVFVDSQILGDKKVHSDTNTTSVWNCQLVRQDLPRQLVRPNQPHKLVVQPRIGPFQKFGSTCCADKQNKFVAPPEQTQGVLEVIRVREGFTTKHVFFHYFSFTIMKIPKMKIQVYCFLSHWQCHRLNCHLLNWTTLINFSSNSQ